ncbi:MAG: hypothetical protein BWX99_02304 [Deltaproteobacteria bacterium ADurb.Bin151]|nr:MAG: hypothetical protein BWX99_02304 [Deltaproteobacteria bacterium ADurb.Bin151]
MTQTKNVQNIICLVILLMLASQAWAEDWVYYGSNDIGDMYYDKSRITEVKKNIASAWTKNKLSPEGKTKYYSILKGIGKAPDSPASLEYYTEMLEIDQANKKIKNISVTFYDDKGNVIYSSPKSLSGEWNDIPAGSVGEKLLDRMISESVAPRKAFVYTPPVVPKYLPQYRGDQDKIKKDKDVSRPKSGEEIEDKKGELAMASRPATPPKEIRRDDRFIAYDNETVLDTQTNLMWAAKDNGRDIDWYSAQKYCENFRGGGYTDWRLPKKDELAELFDKSNPKHQACFPKYEIYLTNLIDLSCCCPWAAEREDSDAAYFNFDHGRTHWDERSEEVKKMYRVLPVRVAK